MEEDEEDGGGWSSMEQWSRIYSTSTVSGEGRGKDAKM
jgi:hypothetical protein